MKYKVVELFSGNADITHALINKGVNCVGYNDFLGRCKMPSRLIDDICIAVGIALYGKENKQ